MPGNLADTVTYADPISFQTVGDLIMVSALISTLTQIASRTKYNKDRIDYLDGAKLGIKRVRLHHNFAALQAVGPADRADGDFAWVKGYGAFRWDNASAAATETGWVILPTDAPVTGRWIGLLASLRNVAGGFPTLDGSALLQVAQLPASVPLFSAASITRVMRTPKQDNTLAVAGGGKALSVAATEDATQALELPNGATLTAVTVYIDRNNSGVLPGTRAQMVIWKRAIATGTTTQIGSVVQDPNATVGPYEAYHGFGQTGLSEVINNATHEYYVALVGEVGANSEPVLFWGASATFTPAAFDPGAG